MQLGMLGNERLREERRSLRIEARAEPVGEHLDHGRGNVAAVLDVIGEDVPVGREVEALVVVLHPHPVREGPQVVAEMQVPGRTHAGQDAVSLQRFIFSQIFAERMKT